ncbi:MAG: STAS domain-containing protein [Magnetococcales bacterium]|nr:STAS domain-containing protein [Magnetococcales bacterium]MBF0155686.1 STAS domain-containing protein [Magnetococcales bacterium]
MSGTISVNRGENETVIGIKGRFNFEMHSQFRTAYQSETGSSKGRKFVIDLAGTEYIDSSALGMLLLLREEAGTNEAEIEIVNARPEIKKILETANFQRLFKIS